MSKLIKDYFSTGVTCFEFGSLKLTVKIVPNEDDSEWSVTIGGRFDELTSGVYECILGAMRWFVGSAADYILASKSDMLHPIFKEIIEYLLRTKPTTTEQELNLILCENCVTINNLDDKITLNGFATLVMGCQNWNLGRVISRYECK